MPRHRVRFAPTPTGDAAPLDDDEDAIALAELRAGLHPVLQFDLALVRWLVHWRRGSRVLGPVVTHATSWRRRTRDASMLLWLVFLGLGLPALGWSYLWITVGNAVGALALQHLAAVLRPVDLEPALAHDDDTSRDDDTWGFPCVDSHMAVVVVAPVLLLEDETTGPSSNTVRRGLLVLVVLFLALSRLAHGRRFASQVLGSWATGLTGLLLGNHGHVTIAARRLPRLYNTTAVVVLVAAVLVIVGTWIENNDSRVVGVPKGDFVQVLQNILSSDAPPVDAMPPAVPTRAVTATAGGLSSSSRSPARVHQLPRRSRQGPNDEVDHAPEEEDDQERAELAGRKDSFYYLMRGMRARAAAARRRPRRL